MIVNSTIAGKIRTQTLLARVEAGCFVPRMELVDSAAPNDFDSIGPSFIGAASEGISARFWEAENRVRIETPCVALVRREGIVPLGPLFQLSMVDYARISSS